MRVDWRPAGSQTWTTFGRPRYLLEEADGLGGSEVDLHLTRAPEQDGSSLIDQVLRRRSISLSMAVFGRDAQRFFEARRSLTRLMNPKRGKGTLRVITAEGTYLIDAVADGSPYWVPASQTRAYQRVVVDLLAPDPLFYSPGEFAETLLTYIGGMSFPLSLPTEFSEQAAESSVVVDNEGDVATPVTMRFWGPATQPISVTNNTTGEQMESTTNLLEDQILVIETAFGRKDAYIEEEGEDPIPALHYISLGSSFWHLVPGENEIEFETGAPGEVAQAEITWRHRYLGV